MKPTIKIAKLEKLANQIRRHIITMAGTARVPHAGSALSAVEIVTTLYFGDVLRINPKRPRSPERDRFIFSKGHASAVLYATLAERGFFPKSKLATYAADGSTLTCHPSQWGAPGVEVQAGSLGHGLAMGIGMALAARHDKKRYRVYVLLSDGECDEGSVWEGILFAGHHKLDNLTVFIDYNKIQSFGRTAEVLNLEPFAEKFRSFHWHVQEINGHDPRAIINAVKAAREIKDQPQCIIAHTVKGKGISFFEDKLESHYINPSDELMERALKELA